jgi:uncharacterized protein
MKKILIFGGTGFIGRHLISELTADYDIVVVSRNPEKNKNILPSFVQLAQLNFDHPENLLPFFDEADAIINLSGENIGAGRWTESFRKKISDSREKVNNLIVSVFEKSKNKPGLVIQSSAIGIYGSRILDEETTESSPVTDEGLLAKVAFEQEKSLQKIENKTRLVFIRSGIILDKKEGALPRIALPFKLFAGGKLGSGRQWIPWIHISDEIRAIRFIIENKNIHGPVNLTAPGPVRQADFAKTLAKAIQRPSWLPAPSFGLKLLLGEERAESLLLTGLKVIPKKLMDTGFQFQFMNLEKALEAIYR